MHQNAPHYDPNVNIFTAFTQIKPNNNKFSHIILPQSAQLRNINKMFTVRQSLWEWWL